MNPKKLAKLTDEELARLLALLQAEQQRRLNAVLTDLIWGEEPASPDNSSPINRERADRTPQG